MCENYTIPSDNRELQLPSSLVATSQYYTIPSDNRELQPLEYTPSLYIYYTIPSDNRELHVVRQIRCTCSMQIRCI